MKKRIICLLLSIITIISMIPGFAMVTEAADYASELRSKGFPEAYISQLTELHKKYPNWSFEPLITNLDWSYAVSKERSPHSKQLVQKTSSNSTKGYYCDCSLCYKNGSYVIQEGSTWVSASQKAVEFYMNPSNFLTEQYILQFESTAYDSRQTIDGIETIIAGTWMSHSYIKYVDANGREQYYSPATKYSEAILAAAKNSGLSAYYLASKIVQEVGGKTNSAGGASGKNSTYPGIYNYYNIGAYTGAVDGLKWASTTLTGYVTNCTCRMRQQPTTNSSILVTLPTGTKLTHKSTTAKQADGYTWEYVSATYNGKTYTGYIRSDLVNNNGTDKYHRPWTNPYLSIYYGATYIANNFSKTQNTGYLQKFNVNPASGSSMFSHEYMANVQAAASEASISYKAYNSAGLLSAPKTFIIPVFKNMPNTTNYSSSIPAVKNIKNTDKTGITLSLSWDAVSGANGYEIQMLTNGNWLTYTTANATSALISKLEPGTSYTFRIRAFSRSGSSVTYSTNWSSSASFTTLSASEIPDTLGTVTNIKLSNSTTNSFDISYDSPTGANGYMIEGLINGEWVSLLKTGYTSRTITGLQPATVYQIRVTSAVKTADGTIIYSNKTSDTYTAVTKPNKIENVQTSWRSDDGTQLKISWDAQNNADGYVVYKKQSDQWVAIDTVYGGGNNELLISNLTPDTEYTFAVRGFKGGTGNLGAYSDEHKTFTPEYIDEEALANSLGIVTNIKLSNSTTNSFDISYDSPAGANGYMIEGLINGEWVSLLKTGYTSRTITGLDPATVYDIRVTAAFKTKAGKIIYSKKVSPTYTAVTKPNKVENVQTSWRSDDGTQLKISWDAQNNADGYVVYRKQSNQWIAIDTVYGGDKNELLISNLTPDTEYIFAVRGFKGGTGNLGAFSDEHKTSTPEYIDEEALANSLGIVTNIKLSNSTTNSFDISYDSPAGANGYMIEGLINGEWVSLLKTGYTSRTITGLDPATVYDIRVTAAFKTKEGKIIYSKKVSPTYTAVTKPNKVENVQTSWRSTDGTQIKITWDAQNNADGYVIYKKGYTQWWVLDTVYGGENNELLINDLISSYDYTFKVRAFKGGEGNLGADSDEHKTYAACGQPKITDVRSDSANSITLKWDGVSCHGYEVMWSTSPTMSSNTKSVIVNDGSTTATVTTAKSNEKYYIRVRAYAKKGSNTIYSVWTGVKEITTK